MSYQEEEQSKLIRQSSKQAITLAMQGQWREAIAVNQTIIDMFPRDVEAHNRMGKSYMELGEYSQAEEAYNRTMEIDPYNVIASKNLKRLCYLKNTAVTLKSDFRKLESQNFIREVGKAGVVQLDGLAPSYVLARVVAGDSVNLKVDEADLIVESRHGAYLGQVKAKHGQRLAKLIEGGNKYAATVVSSSERMIYVIIREIYQDPRQLGRLSFPAKKAEGARPNVGDRVIRRELEHEENLPAEPGYTIIGGEGTELSPEEFGDGDDENENEE